MQEKGMRKRGGIHINRAQPDKNLLAISVVVPLEKQHQCISHLVPQTLVQLLCMAHTKSLNSQLQPEMIQHFGWFCQRQTRRQCRQLPSWHSVVGSRK